VPVALLEEKIAEVQRRTSSPSATTSPAATVRRRTGWHRDVPASTA